MKIFKVIFSIIIFNFLFFNYNIKVFANTWEDEYKNGEKLGEYFGYYDGILEGFKYLYAIDITPNYKDLIDRYEVENKYKYYLNNQSNVYNEGFMSGYYASFIKGYNEILKGNNPSDDADLNIRNTDYADMLGLLTGEVYGFKDYYASKDLNPPSALPSDIDIVDMFDLNRFNYQDRHSFLNTFKKKFREGYVEGYTKSNLEIIKLSYDEGLHHGEYIGKILGRNYGAKDYFENNTLNYTRNMPSDSTIIEKFLLNSDVTEYVEGFLVGFKRAYEKSYNECYRAMNLAIHRRTFEMGYNQGKISGMIKGETKALEDYYFKSEKNWRKHLSTQARLIREYDLHNESTGYIEGFYSGFLEGLSEEYDTKYQQLSQESAISKTKSEVLPISGGEISSLDGKFHIKVESGIYYNPIVISIDILPDNYYIIDSEYIKASNFYKVSILNKSNGEDNQKDIELKFEYYGKNYGGIYKLSNGLWLYLPSYIEDGYITTYVKPNSFRDKGNIYVVLIDKNYNVLLDIRSHWAKNEIIAFQRRGIVSGYSDNNFKPDNNISKGEFLALLSRVYNWDVVKTIDEIKFNDLLQYAREKGYIDNWGMDSIFANKGVSYREIESIMSKILESDSFQWDNISTKILYEKNYRSKYYDSPDNFITRAEAVYMLYILNDWRY
ncbi:S-layer homology domain-containing protein [Tepidimicrobium xylanilyticum]|uniref:S-layer homology domain-containing protein n=1 Tax=Tepidimicrobium xylanilyticum TaxID=1123352 RepID=A0A1H3CP91_9FIRM|nr:S-layer homology domain-containing protein [Tepidimicrobium xylanilyticum]GMG97698.1 hypothetical protein EN5CB1_25240 [Tepidimicrobium xylanilyticum]SDX55850.1 S-layer homology domain-containing protein [Tepidimicrobium xylanilyticum]